MPTRMFRTVRTGRMMIGAAVAALLLGACVNNDVDGGDLRDALEEAGANPDQARCAAERFDDELDQDERNDVAQASDDEEIEELPERVRTTYMSIMDECIGGEEPAEESTTTTAPGAAPEESTTSSSAAAG
jgi:hypothetical protein